MFPYRLRARILKKIAQAVTDTAATQPTSTDDTASPTMQEIPPAADFVASLRYGNVQKAFPTAYGKINQISGLLNEAINTATNGKYNLQKLYLNNFSGSFTDQVSNAKFLLNFAKEMYDKIYKVDPSPISKQEFTNIVNELMNSANLNSLSDTNLAGSLSQTLNIGDIKAKILGELNNLKNIAPAE
jgi:hypothetical protein